MTTSRITRRRLASTSMAAFVSAGISPRVLAQGAGRSARMLVGFPAGGPADLVARLLTNSLSGYASTFIVDNRPGAGGRVALDALKTSAPDGSVAILTPASMLVIYPHIYRTLNYNALQDFIPVTTACAFPLLVSVGPMVPGEVRTLADFVAWSRANPGRATYGTAGAGSMLHFTGVMLGRAAGFAFTHVPYKGAGPATQDMLAGQIAATVDVFGNALPHVQAGRVRALVTTGPQRSALLPDVPTAREAGYPGLEAVEWFGVLVAARTPPDVVDRLNAAIRDALKRDEVKAALANLFFEAGGLSPGDFGRLVKSDYERWGPIVQASGFTPED